MNSWENQVYAIRYIQMIRLKDNKVGLVRKRLVKNIYDYFVGMNNRRHCWIEKWYVRDQIRHTGSDIYNTNLDLESFMKDLFSSFPYRNEFIDGSYKVYRNDQA